MTLDELREFLVAEKETDDFFPVRDARFIAAIALVDKLRDQKPVAVVEFMGVRWHQDLLPLGTKIYALPVLPKEMPTGERVLLCRWSDTAWTAATPFVARNPDKEYAYFERVQEEA